MADTQRKHWTAEEFLAWESRQDARHELVRGVVRAMVGGTYRHGVITGNVFAFLHGALRGETCRPFLADMKVSAPAGNFRYPDVLVDCGDAKQTDLAAAAPTVAIEVLSKSTAFVDQTDKLDDYQSIPSMRHILHLTQERAAGELWTRTEQGWLRAPLRGLDAVAEFTALGVSLAFATAYEGVEFDPEPPPQNDNQ